MKLRHLGAASALILGLAAGGVAAAQTATNTGGGDATATNFVLNGVNGNSLGSGNDNSNAGNDYSTANGNVVDSNNTTDSGNTRVRDSQNNNSNQSNDYSNNSGQNNSLNLDLRVNVSEQTLSSNVSDIGFNDTDMAGTDNRAVSGGALTYTGSNTGWAGIQTGTTNTGVASNNLAATAVSANANVNFGAAAGTP